MGEAYRDGSYGPSLTSIDPELTKMQPNIHISTAERWNPHSGMITEQF